MRRLGRVFRDAWLVVGVATVILLSLEAAYRSQGFIRREWRERNAPAAVPPDHPYADEAWWAEWLEGAGAWQNRYDPYRGIWPEPREGALLNIDSLGRRVTVQQQSSAGATPYRIYLFGGSTMFGYTARDAWTIPSRLAALIADAGVGGVEVVNFAQSSFNVTQNVATLSLELRNGRIPDAVVFLDGNNEVAPAFQSGRAGGVLNEAMLAERLRARPSSLFDVLARRLTFVTRLRQVFERDDAPDVEHDPAAYCPAVASTYAGAISLVERLGSSYGFETLFLWQPMLATTRKPLTGFERSVLSSPQWKSAVLECSRLADEINSVRTTYASLASLFDDHAETVFLDDYGHVTEAANERIAQAIFDRLKDVLPRASTASSSTSPSGTRADVAP